jgi:hypothetical protein
VDWGSKNPMFWAAHGWCIKWCVFMNRTYESYFDWKTRRLAKAGEVNVIDKKRGERYIRYVSQETSGTFWPFSGPGPVWRFQLLGFYHSTIS